MKIVLDFRMFGPAFGLGRYNQKLLEHLFLIDKENQYIVLMRQLPKDIVWPTNFQVKIVNVAWYGLAEQLVLPIVLYRLKPDLVHFPHFNVPILYRAKFIVTIHDLIMTKFPSRKTSTLNYFTFSFKRLAYQIIIKSAVKRAKNIIAVSNFTAQDIVNYFHLNKAQSQKIKVIYEGLSLINEKQDIKLLDLPEKYFLYVGNAYPHKNLEFLIKTFKDFLLTHPDFYLILVGNKNYFYKQLETWAKAYLASVSKRVIFAGFIDDNDLISYYRQAKAYIFPSLYEGFGLPALEAFQQQLPVLSSNSSCLPEVLGEAALYFDPNRAEELLEKMETIIKNQDLKNKLILAGQEQLKKYSWQQAAIDTLALYK